jgi:PAS domain S-box-containing protein
MMGLAPQIATSINNAVSYGMITESERRFRAITENSPAVLYSLDVNGDLTYVNPAGKNILGYGREELIGQPFLRLMRKEDEGTYLQFFRKIRDDKETINSFRCILLSKERVEGLYDISGAPNFDEKRNVIGVVGTLRDITEQSNAEKQMHGTSEMNDIHTLIEPTEECEYDAFICHASEDKNTVARPLAEKLKEFGFSIWYDECTLEIGDSLRRSIDKGLVNSRYGIVILSPAFFKKEWPQYELNGLTAREIKGKKVILPVWHRIEKADIEIFSPPLADKVAGNTLHQSLAEIARQLSIVLRKVQ